MQNVYFSNIFCTRIEQNVAKPDISAVGI